MIIHNRRIRILNKETHNDWFVEKVSPFVSNSFLISRNFVIPAILAIPDTLFFLPAFPFSDYCLKHRKAQFVEYQPEES